MTTVNLPSLFCPFPPASNPHSDAVQAQMLARWSKLLGLGPDDSAYKRFEAAQFGALLGRCHPRATEEDLTLIVDFTVWLFFWDDRCDRCDQGMSSRPDQLQALNLRADEVLMGIPSTPEDEPLIRALADVRQRLRRRMPGPWLTRFVRNLQDYLEATVWQAANAESGTIPDLQTYMRMRRLTGGVCTAMDLAAFAERIVLPLKVRTHPILAKMMRATNNLVTWANDIFSLDKELAHGDHHNLVVVIRNQDQCSTPAALAHAIEVHDAEMSSFSELERRLPSFGPELDRDVRLFVEGLRSWIRGNIDWSTTLTERYRNRELSPAQVVLAEIPAPRRSAPRPSAPRPSAPLAN